MGLIVKATPKKKDIPSNLSITYPKKGKFKSKHDATMVLSNVYWKELFRGRIIAKQIAMAGDCTCHVRQVVDAMIAEGSWIAGEKPEHWVSFLFPEDEWEWSGQWVWTKSTSTQGGSRSTKVWRLKACH